MAIFQPPTDPFAVSFAKPESSVDNKLMSRLEPIDRGRNVYLLVDGTYTESQPGDWADIAKIYLGGHRNEVTAAEVASLTAAGYGAYITA